MSSLPYDERRRSLVRILAASAVAFLAGMTASGYLLDSSDKTQSDISTTESSVAVAGPGPARTSDEGMPQGFARSNAGAIAAAVSYVLSGQRLLELPPTRIGDAIRTIAASASAAAQVAEAEQQLRQLRAVLADGTGATHYIQAVLATRVDAYAADRARVAVWSVGVLSRGGVARPQAGWTISTFELVWERDDWKVWSESITPGPAPSLNAGVAPSSSEQLDQALSGFVWWRSSQ